MAMSRPKNVQAYLAAVPEPGRGTLKKLRTTIRSVLPRGATEGIGYGIPVVKYEGGLLGYAAFKKHISVFPMTGHALDDKLEQQLKPYRTSKGTLQFPLDRPVPATLIKRLVKTRVAENLERKAQRAAKKKVSRRATRAA